MSDYDFIEKSKQSYNHSQRIAAENQSQYSNAERAGWFAAGWIANGGIGQAQQAAQGQPYSYIDENGYEHVVYPPAQYNLPRRGVTQREVNWILAAPLIFFSVGCSLLYLLLFGVEPAWNWVSRLFS